jgi:hypothetical protein
MTAARWLQVHNIDVVHGVRAVLFRCGIEQNPCLECAEAEADDVFIC